jgi:glycosyltransferase involved in cell wall biosynthesis
MCATARVSADRKVLLVNHFDLATVCGTTVMFGELLRLAPRLAPPVALAYESHAAHASPAALRTRLEAAHRDSACVVAINAHIEVSWDFTTEVFDWCRARGLAAYVHAHDYWPQHREALGSLQARFGARILASTAFIAETLRQAGFESQLLPVGVPLPDDEPAPRRPASPPVVASAGRLVPRKRLPDIVRAYAASGLDGRARLYVRALPSQVFGAAADREQLCELEAEIARAGLSTVLIDRSPGERPDYGRYSAYVCASSYEGFSMTVIEAAFHGCPPLMSDITPHRRIAHALFGEQAGDFLFPVGDHRALGGLLRDELATSRRGALVASHLGAIRAAITERWSLRATGTALARLAAEVRA